MAASKDKARAILSYATPNPVGPYRLVTPPTPDLGVGKTKTPILPVMGGTLVNLPTPVMPTKQTTPVAPPLSGRLVNVPTETSRVINAALEKAKEGKAKPITWREWGKSGYGNMKVGKVPLDFDVSIYDSNYSGPQVPFNEVTVYDADGKIGRLEWSKDTGEILMVEVDKQLQRKGIATEMMRLAIEAAKKYSAPVPQHSRDRTPAGDAWAKSVGGVLPPIITEAEIESRRRRTAIGNLQRAGIANPTEKDIQGQFAEWRRRGVL